MGKKLGALIREQRKKANLKVYELADKVSVTPEFITEIEKGDRYPSSKVLERICKVLGSNIRPVFYDERYPEVVAVLLKTKGLLQKIKAANSGRLR